MNTKEKKKNLKVAPIKNKIKESLQYFTTSSCITSPRVASIHRNEILQGMKEDPFIKTWNLEWSNHK